MHLTGPYVHCFLLLEVALHLPHFLIPGADPFLRSAPLIWVVFFLLRLLRFLLLHFFESGAPPLGRPPRAVSDVLHKLTVPAFARCLGTVLPNLGFKNSVLVAETDVLIHQSLVLVLQFFFYPFRLLHTRLKLLDQMELLVELGHEAALPHFEGSYRPPLSALRPRTYSSFFFRCLTSFRPQVGAFLSDFHSFGLSVMPMLLSVYKHAKNTKK